MIGRFSVLFTALVLGSFSIFPQTTNVHKRGSGNTLYINKTEKPKGIAEEIEGRVVTVEDGDTISVQLLDQTVVTVRLQAIDAPEFKQDNFKKSKNSLSALVLNKNVKVTVAAKDDDARLVGTVFVDGRDAGLIQLEKGMAWHYRRLAYEQTPEVRKQYADAQAKAQSNVVGIWSEKRPVPPWVFRGDISASPPPRIDPVEVTRSAPPPPPDRKYILGPMGGCYYLADDGHKVYVKDKSRCIATPAEDKP
jgi:endonuclease YncB( thermonuclease family)